MAINPNTDFTTGAVLTAAEQNRFPRGVVALATSVTNMASTTAETLSTGMSVTFTAVANRYYKVTYRENAPFVSTTAGAYTLRVRRTNLAGAIVVASNIYLAVTGQNTVGDATVITTFTAGSVTLVGSVEKYGGSGTVTLERNAFGNSVGAFILVEDLGPA